MRPALALFLLAAACAVPPRLDPTTLGAVPPEARFTLRTPGSSVEVDHLRVDGDSVRGHLISTTVPVAASEIAVARDSTLEVRRAYHGTPDIEFALLPPVLLLGFLLVFRAMMGSD